LEEKKALNHLNDTIKTMVDHDLYSDSSDDDFVSILKLAAYITNCKASAISFIEDQKQNMRYVFGPKLQPVEMLLNDSLCQFLSDKNNFTEISDLSQDPRTNELYKTGLIPYSYYGGLPFYNKKNEIIGSICVFKDSSNLLEENQILAFSALIDQITKVLSLRKGNLKNIANETKEEEFKTLFNFSPDLICILNDEQEITSINSSSIDFLGLTPDECEGVNISNFIHPHDRKNVLETASNFLSNNIKSFEIETRLIAKERSQKWISWNAVTNNRKWFIIGRDITNTKEVLKNLNQLSTVASKINNGIVISDANSKVIWVNNAFTNITGYQLEDVTNHKLGDVILGEDSNTDIVENARKATEDKKSFAVELLAYTKEGKPIWLSVFNTIILDDDGKIESLIEIVVDITERKKSEEKLELLSLVASKTDVGVSICDKDGRVSWINDSLIKILGYELNELYGKRIGDVVKGTDTDTDILLDARKKVQNLLPYNIEQKVYIKDGTEIWLSISNTPIRDEKNNSIKQIEIIADITKKKYVEFQLVQAKEQALQLSKAKEMFLSVMSHEIRTPLNAIIGLSNILADEKKLPEQKQTINLLKFSSDNLLALVNDILDFSKIEVGKMELENKRLNIKELIRDIAHSLAFKVKEKNIQLKYNVSSNIPELVRGDKTRLYQILINLINNAIKFTNSGFVEIIVELIKLEEHQIHIQFTIIDTGIGISPDKFDSIFESFTQAYSNTFRKYGGSGLGLTITKKLIELYQGDIKVESEIGKGSTFSFDIKFNNFIEVNQVNKEVQMDELLSEGKILVVDDNEINIMLASKVLIKYGFDVISAVNGFEAIKLLENRDFDLVLMDVHMPEISGYETTKKIREINDEYFKNLPIIALTASILKDDMSEIYKCGMTDYHVKPFKAEELFKKISKYLKVQKSLPI
jgi:PAS domain S-box-containing protein